MRRPLAWAAVLVGEVLLAVWMLRQPPALPSDDALFFARGLDHFDVLAFSPHFPGYPGFVALGRLVHWFVPAAETALFLTSVLCALAVPPTVAWAAWRWTVDADRALLAFALALTQPLLPALGLGMLSDAAGLLFFVAFLGALAGPSWGFAGVLLAMAATCRPSYAVMIAAALGVVVLRDRRRAPALLLGLVGPCVVAFGVVLAVEGWWPYLQEGLRFVAGHATLWGNTALTGDAHGGDDWLDVAAARPLLLVPLIAGLAAAMAQERRPGPTAAVAALIASVVWTVTMQNADNLRHAAPTLVLAGLLVATARPPALCRITGTAALAAQGVVLAATLALAPDLPPLAAAAAALDADGQGTVVTNHGVALLRRDLTRHRVVDAYYRADAAFAVATAPAPVWRLSSTPPPPDRAAHRFDGRCLGEAPLWAWTVRAR